jgi:hypothetical protein
LMRARRARFSSRMSDVSLTPAGVEPDRAGWRKNKEGMQSRKSRLSVDPAGSLQV